MKFTKIIAAAAALMLLSANAYADGINVKLNGKNVDFDVAPVYDNKVLFVQAKPVLEKIGYSVGWNSEERKITISCSTDMYEMTIGNGAILANGQEIVLNSTPMIIMNRTFIPVEFIERVLGYSTMFDASAMTEYINSGAYMEVPEDIKPPVEIVEQKDYNSMYENFKANATPEELSDAYDLMFAVDIDYIKSIANDIEAVKEYLSKTITPEQYEKAIRLYEKYGK